jgi:hypothetical protein
MSTGCQGDYVTVRTAALNWMIRELNPAFHELQTKTLKNFS